MSVALPNVFLSLRVYYVTSGPECFRSSSVAVSTLISSAVLLDSTAISKSGGTPCLSFLSFP